jgi:hypothetical protein
MTYIYEINPGPAALGGSWQVRLLDEGEEVGEVYFLWCSRKWQASPGGTD